MEKCLNFFVKGKPFRFFDTGTGRILDLTFSELMEKFIDDPCRGICVILPDLKGVWILFDLLAREWIVYDTKNKLYYPKMEPLLDHDCLKILPKSPSFTSFNVLPLIVSSNVKHLCTLRNSLSDHLCYGFINRKNEYVVFEHPVWSLKRATVVISDPLTFLQTSCNTDCQYLIKTDTKDNIRVAVTNAASFVTFNDTFENYVRAITFWINELSPNGCETYVHNRDIYFCWLWPFVRIKYFKQSYRLECSYTLRA